MCRWLAYSGSPILMKEALYGGENSFMIRACTHGSGPSRPTVTGSASGGTGSRPPRACFTASNRPGTTRTCARSPATSALRCSSRTFGRRSAAPCSRPTATPSVTTAGCSCTTATSTSSPRSSATSMLAVDPSLYPEIQGQADTEVLFYLALTLGLEDDPPAAVAAGDRARRGGRRPPRRRRIRSRARSRPPTARASGRSGTPASVRYHRGGRETRWRDASGQSRSKRFKSEDAARAYDEAVREVSPAARRADLAHGGSGVYS